MYVGTFHPSSVSVILESFGAPVSFPKMRFFKILLQYESFSNPNLLWMFLVVVRTKFTSPNFEISNL